MSRALGLSGVLFALSFCLPSCGGGGSSGGTGGSSATGGSGTGGTQATGGTPGTGGSGTGGTATGGSSGGTGGVTGTGGTATGGSGTGGTSTGGAGGKGGGAGGKGGGAGSGTGGSPAGGAGGGSTSCAGHALSLSANGTSSDSDTAMAHVEADLKTDLPTANAKRTVEYWAFIKTTDWVGDKNEMFYYGGGSGTDNQFGMDFGTNPVSGMSSNHATLDPFTNGKFSDDSTDNLGINSSTDQWVHIAMVWDGTSLLVYVNGALKITSTGSGGNGMLATGTSVLSIGCNPTNNQCFNGLFDEFRVWSVARSASDIMSNYNKPLTGTESGLVAYYKFDETSGTTAADSVTSSGHTAHPGTLKADTTAHNPTFIVPPTPLPLLCP